MKLLSIIMAAWVCLRAVSAAEPPGTILVIGDSIAAGYGLDPDQSFPALVEEKARAAGLDYRVINGGSSGDTTAGGLRRISWLLKNPADLVLIELGGNDGLRGVPPEETEQNLKGIIDKVRAKYPAAKIVLAGMQMPENMGKEYTEKFKHVYIDVAREKNVALIPFLLEGVGGKAELNQPDRIHPTAEGHEIIAETVWKVLRPLLEETPETASQT